MGCNCVGNENVDSAVLSCTNPCGVSQKNTAACESLPSQIQNFTDQFFGTVVKTEVNGKVEWSLPCNLDIGLPANPRGVGEGLACYFVRLFSQGIQGLEGPKGDPGAAGANGNSAYTVVMQSFAQPTLVNPVVQIVTPYNPAIRAGLYIFVDGSGWYIITDTDGNGLLFCQFVKAVDSPVTTVPVGALVVPSGFPGPSVTGPAGPQGPVGPQGPAGSSATLTNDYYVGNGTNFVVPLAYTAVTFINNQPNFLLPVAGTYLIIATVGVTGNAGVAASDVLSLKLRNTSNNSDIAGALAQANSIATTTQGQLVVVGLAHTAASNQTVALFASGSVDSHFVVLAADTSMVYVRLS